MPTRYADTFEKKFKPIVPEGSEWGADDAGILRPLELTDDMLDGENRHLWTLVDPMVDSGMQYWLPGYHYVNREGYVFTEVPWTDADLADEYRRW